MTFLKVTKRFEDDTGCFLIETWQGFIEQENSITPFDKTHYIPALTNRFSPHYCPRHWIALHDHFEARYT